MSKYYLFNNGYLVPSIGLVKYV
ncbi:hypothetical protein B4U80_03333 [Leptotrombidium deliense]|uniref:Uncharacterized protein n=1 Tax=Leptotrombidium deliense TaxID=299467 RepID=A0A443RVW3_9ACAR|nr:hypothetical protein B4U80_03333 [Leptotrombidium deliense]